MWIQLFLGNIIMELLEKYLNIIKDNISAIIFILGAISAVSSIGYISEVGWWTLSFFSISDLFQINYCLIEASLISISFFFLYQIFFHYPIIYLIYIVRIGSRYSQFSERYQFEELPSKLFEFYINSKGFLGVGS